MIVYISSPYTKGDVGTNVHRVIEIADKIVAIGHTPFVPHLTHLWHLVSPKPAEFWYEYDMAFLSFCDALLRVDGDSVGADNEVKQAKMWCIPIYYSLEELLGEKD